MADLPVLKDWKNLLDGKLSKSTYGEPDILHIIYMCQDYMSEIQPVSQWLGQQDGFVRQMYSVFINMYATMFGKQPPTRPAQVATPEVLLDTPALRKQAIREVALSITKPGDEVADEGVLEELKRRNMRLETFNPTAGIATILNGFKSQFAKVEGRRGVFKRLQ